MKFVSWNVNGFRAVLNKGFDEFFTQIDADFFCIQETKMQENQHTYDFLDYKEFYNYAVKKGYSGTAILSKQTPLSVNYGINLEDHDQEGRVITCEYDDFYLVTVYTPNSKRGLERLDYRMIWEDEFQTYINKLDEIKPVIVCGDLNVAHQKIDLKNPSSNRLSAGFTDEERSKMTQFLNNGFVDSFRYLHPHDKDRYTWWSYMAQSRARNVGWRIDYFLVSERIKDKIIKAEILDHVMGSDHCPIYLEMDL